MDRLFLIQGLSVASLAPLMASPYKSSGESDEDVMGDQLRGDQIRVRDEGAIGDEDPAPGGDLLEGRPVSAVERLARETIPWPGGRGMLSRRPCGGRPQPAVSPTWAPNAPLLAWLIHVSAAAGDAPLGSYMPTGQTDIPDIPDNWWVGLA